MEEIVSAVKRVTDIMAEIAAASQEQTSGIEQVNQAITQMDQTTQQNAALVEEAAAAAESMQEQAKSLTKAVAIFKLAQAGVAPSPTAPLPKRVSREEKGSRPSPRGKEVEADGNWDGKAERRSPNRAKNVARLPQPGPQPKVANGDDNWQEF